MRQALEMALEALERGETELRWKAITAIKEALAQPEPVQVSALEFVEMVYEKEHLVGKPIVWAQWPNPEEKNT